MTVKEIEAAVLRLPVRKRARLAKVLLESLDETPDPGVLEAWLDEAERRYRLYREGKTKAIPAGEVLRKARRRLR
jgi:putative addiction module component (TIGR02574 family)